MAKDSKTKTKTKRKKASPKSKRKKAHPNSLKNLKLFKKGKSGNPDGAPKGKHLTTLLKELVEEQFKAKNPFSKKIVKKTLAEWICMRLTAQAIKGNIPATKIVFDRLDGKVAEDLNIKLDESASIEAIKEKMHLYLKRNQRNEKEK